MIDRRLGLGALLFTLSAHGHHSDAGVDMDALVEFDGTVTEYAWRNPHVYFKVATVGPAGEPMEWLLQMPSTMTMTRMGWSRESLATGEQVRVWTHPSEDGRPYGILEHAQKADGTRLPTSFEHGDRTADPLFDIGENPRAESIEGIWMADRSKLTLYAGGFDGFFREQLVLTDAAKAAQASYDELSSENPESTCVGRPTPAMLVSTTIFPLQIDIADDRRTVMIRSELYDEERTVHMDGRAHPDGGQRFETGHSIGHWEGGVLVVDTANFADHRSPYQIGVPSGAQKHVVERYQLNADRTHLVVDFVLEDPEFLAEPLRHRRELIYSPELQIGRFDCDPETTRRFVVPR